MSAFGTRGLSGRPPSPRMGAEPVVPPGGADGRGRHLPSPKPAARVSWRGTHRRTIPDRPGASQRASDRRRASVDARRHGGEPRPLDPRAPVRYTSRETRAPPSDETRAAARRGLHRGGRGAPGRTSPAGRHRADAARRDPCRHDGHGDHRLPGDDARTLRRTCARGADERGRPAPPPHRGAHRGGAARRDGGHPGHERQPRLRRRPADRRPVVRLRRVLHGGDRGHNADRGDGRDRRGRRTAPHRGAPSAGGSAIGSGRHARAPRRYAAGARAALRAPTDRRSSRGASSLGGGSSRRSAAPDRHPPSA